MDEYGMSEGAFENLVRVMREEKEERKRFENEFYGKEKYLDCLDVVKEQVNNEDRELWTRELDETFSFVYDAVQDLAPCESDVATIRYKGNYIELYEVHGQGCFRDIRPISHNSIITSIIEFEDVVCYHQTGKKPVYLNVIDVVKRGLDTLETAMGENRTRINGEVIELDEVFEYIVDSIDRDEYR